MQRFLSRLCTSLLVLWIVATATFLLMHLLPGDPFTGERALPAATLERLHAHYHLDRPLVMQYCYYLQNLVKGDLGFSLKYPGRSVTSFIVQGFPLSALLGMLALLVALPCGILLGAWAALRPRSAFLNGFALLGLSLPNFMLAAGLQYLFAIRFPLLPLAQWGGPSHLILPILSLALLPTAFVARLMRTSALEVLQQDYVKSAYAKGLSTFALLRRHLLRNALLPIVTYLGTIAANVLTGSFLIEKLFAIPGLGQWFVQSIFDRDYPVIMGITLFYAALLLALFALLDLLYLCIDPRLLRRSSCA